MFLGILQGLTEAPCDQRRKNINYGMVPGMLIAIIVGIIVGGIPRMPTTLGSPRRAFGEMWINLRGHRQYRNAKVFHAGDPTWQSSPISLPLATLSSAQFADASADELGAPTK